MKLIINSKYQIETDESNFILSELKTNADKKSVNFGKEYSTPVGYFPTLQSALKRLITKDLMTSDLKGLQSIINHIEELHYTINKIDFKPIQASHKEGLKGD